MLKMSEIALRPPTIFCIGTTWYHPYPVLKPTWKASNSPLSHCSKALRGNITIHIYQTAEQPNQSGNEELSVENSPLQPSNRDSPPK